MMPPSPSAPIWQARFEQMEDRRRSTERSLSAIAGAMSVRAARLRLDVLQPPPPPCLGWVEGVDDDEEGGRIGHQGVGVPASGGSREGSAPAGWGWGVVGEVEVGGSVAGVGCLLELLTDEDLKLHRSHAHMLARIAECADALGAIATAAAGEVDGGGPMDT